MIAKLNQVMAESVESSKKLQDELETQHKAEVTALSDRHDKAIIEIKQKLLQTQELSARTANENAQFKKQVDILLSKNETLADVGEINTEEINRLRELPKEQEKSLNLQQLQEMTARVEKLELKLSKATSLNIQLEAEKQILEKSSIERQNLLNAEISGLRDQVSDLNAQNQLLLADIKRH